VTRACGPPAPEVPAGFDARARARACGLGVTLRRNCGRTERPGGRDDRWPGWVIAVRIDARVPLVPCQMSMVKRTLDIWMTPGSPTPGVFRVFDLRLGGHETSHAKRGWTRRSAARKGERGRRYVLVRARPLTPNESGTRDNRSQRRRLRRKTERGMLEPRVFPSARPSHRAAPPPAQGGCCHSFIVRCTRMRRSGTSANG
jgi:hypothetical protein